MPISRDSFITSYLEELEDNLTVLDSGILTLKKDPGNEHSLGTLLRALHTIKGSSRMLKFNNIEAIAHGLEKVFKGVKEERYSISKQLIQLVFITTDYFNVGITKIRKTKTDTIDIQKLITTFSRIYENQDFSLDEIRIRKAVTIPSPDLSTSPAAPATKKEISAPSKDSENQKHIEQPDSKGEDTVRINLNRVHDINKLINNLIVKQFQFNKAHDTIKNLESCFDSINVPDETNITMQASSFSVNKNKCLKIIHTLSKTISEELLILQQNTFTIQEEVMALCMQPIEIAVGNLGRMVEETAISLGKEIDFSLTGTNVMLDRSILDCIKDPIIHLVRNSIDHGLETPDERTLKGKNSTGKLEVHCTAENGKVNVLIRDDGRGLDYEKIRQKAIGIYPDMQEDIRLMETRQLNQFLFVSGFSTKESASELSGRGVGLDIVRHNIENINGKIDLRSKTNQGTEFLLSLPLSLATISGFFIETAGEKFLVPSSSIKEILLVPESNFLKIQNKKAIKYRNEIVPIYYLSRLFNKKSVSKKENHVLIIESVEEIIAVVVESIIRHESMIYKPLPEGLKKLKPIQGIVFDEKFQIINILYIPEIIKLLKNTPDILSMEKFSEKGSSAKTILVLDDSLPTREMILAILKSDGYRVFSAADGVEGLEQLTKNHFDLIITDLQMPKMDGKTFVGNMRMDEHYKNTPIIVITSDEDETIKESLLESNIYKYIHKSDFDRDVLLDSIKGLLG